MRRPKILKRSVPLWAVVLSVFAVATVMAALMWDIGTEHVMRLQIDYTLGVEFWIGGEWVEVSEGDGYDWSDFVDEETKNLTVRITNIGNLGVAYPTWDSPEFDDETGMMNSKWHLCVNSSSDDPWPEGKIFGGINMILGGPGSQVTCTFFLTEVNAVAGVEHGFGLSFENNDAAIE